MRPLALGADHILLAVVSEPTVLFISFFFDILESQTGVLSGDLLEVAGLDVLSACVS